MSGSKGQDLVDDSWEEIDEDRLAARLSKLANEEEATNPTGSSSSEGGSSGGRAPPANSLPAMLEEELRPRMILQRPQMQILRRPQTQAQEDEKAATESKPKAQIKSLDQRKQEYAEARLRILGSAHDEEEQQQAKPIEQAPKKGSPNTNGYRINNNNSGSSSSSSSSSNSTNNNGGNIRLDRPPNSFRPPPPGNYHMPQLPAPHPGGSFYGHPSGRNQLPPEGPASINHHYYPQQQPQVGPHVPGGYHFQHHQQHHPQQHHLHQKHHIPPYGMPPQSSTGYHHGMGPIPAYGGGPLGHNSNNNVLRTPAGPDGSHGFTMRR